MSKIKRALVCGASQGIGAAVASELAAHQVQVFALSRTEQKLQQVVGALAHPELDHQVVVQDLSDTKAAKAKVASLVEQWGPMHILVNNAGGPKAGPLLEAEPNDFLKAFTEHVLVSQGLVQALVPGMKKDQFGRIINIISTSVKVPIANLGVSNTIRAAMANWSKSLALELGPFGITVNNVLPGYTLTPRFESLRKATAEKLKVTEGEVEKMWKASIPTGRFCTPEEVADAVGFLASARASSITGINLPVDGGRTPTL